MAEVLTEKRRQILDFIIEHQRDHGYPPSVREIGRSVGLTSSATVHDHIDRLAAGGFLVKDPTKPRALQVRYEPASTTPVTAERVRNVPLVGDIAAGTGVLAEVAGSPFDANQGPTQILFSHSGEFVYAVNPSLGMVSGFVFCPPQRASQPQCSGATAVLSPVPLSPVFSGDGASALAVDGSDQFLYVVNPQANNPPPYQSTVGNISAFKIDSNTGALSQILGSPFTSTAGISPAAIAVDPSSRFVYAAGPGSSNSIWCFAITPTNGALQEVTGSPFSLSSGGQFALFDTTGNFLYIGDESGAAIDGYTYDPATGKPTVIAGSPFSTGTAPGQIVISE